MTQLEGTGCLLLHSLPSLREHMLHCTSIASSTENIHSRLHVPLHARLVQASVRIRIVSRLQCLATFLLVGVVYCYCHVRFILQQHQGDNCLSVCIWCLCSRHHHRHEAIVVTTRFNCHTWIYLWSKRFLCGSFLYVRFNNLLLSCTNQEPVIEKQMLFFCHVMAVELVCFVCVCVCVCAQGKWGSKIGVAHECFPLHLACL